LTQTAGRRGRSGRGRSKAPHPIDVHVGSRVRLRRNILGLSQEKLGDAIGLTFQQVQKYERGANRISASRLLELSRVLDVPISFFYDNVDPVHAPAIPDRLELEALMEDDPLRRPETMQLVTAFYEIDPQIQRRLLNLARQLARPPDSPPTLRGRRSIRSTKR
jgi:transcriptional regulator with XRE-family HTH domain